MESRLATLTLDLEDLSKLSEMGSRPELPSTFQLSDIAQLVTTLPLLFNSLIVRRAILPAANGHCSARALARYYAALVDGGLVPPPHSSSSKPTLGSLLHHPKFSSQNNSKKQKVKKASTNNDNYMRIANDIDNSISSSSSSRSNMNNQRTIGVAKGDVPQTVKAKIYNNSRIHDAFLGVGEYSNLVLPDGKFGLGFRRISPKDGSLIGFGHSGMGGSTGYCDINNRFAIAVTLNKMCLGTVTGKIIHFVCSELSLPIPEDYARFGEGGPDMQLNLGKPMIN